MLLEVQIILEVLFLYCDVSIISIIYNVKGSLWIPAEGHEERRLTAAASCVD